MKAYVIDANVALKWVVKESYRQEAKQYLDSRIKRIAPDLILIECANAIRRKILLKEITLKEGDESFLLIQNSFQKLMELKPTLELLNRAYEISKELIYHPVPDCLYLALAEQDNAHLITGDKRFYDKVKLSRFRSLITWIEDMP